MPQWNGELRCAKTISQSIVVREVQNHSCDYDSMYGMIVLRHDSVYGLA